MKTRIPIILFVLCTGFGLFGQGNTSKKVKVKGVVIDSIGFPVHKGQVFADSLITGFRTNKKGEFKLRIPSDTKIIGIFSEEYGMQNVTYNGQEELNIRFSKNTSAVTEKELTDSGYILDPEVFRNIGKKSYAEYTNIFQIIREKFTGVTIRGDDILVRGYIGGDQTPLYIVDGNYVNSIAGINPDELKSIELLKGEDAAFYGARGAPGVFIISLK